MIAYVLFFSLSLISFFLWRKYSKPLFIFSHLLFLITPLILLANELNCYMSMISGFLAFCTMVIAKVLLYFIPVAAFLAFIVGYFLMPFLYRRSNQCKKISHSSVSLFSKKWNKLISLYAVDKAYPVAFTIKKDIFISIGMLELLSKKELEAVLLHEIGHIYNKSSWLKLSSIIARFISPIAHFSSLTDFISKEEQKADEFAIAHQKTDKYLISAKKKLG